MPRPRKNDPTSLINPIITDFAHRLAAVVERFTVGRIEAAVRASGNALQGRRGRAGGAGRTRGKTLCYYPGCKNVAAPRFGMFCAALHKDIPKDRKREVSRRSHGKKTAPPSRPASAAASAAVPAARPPAPESRAPLHMLRSALLLPFSSPPVAAAGACTRFALGCASRAHADSMARVRAQWLAALPRRQGSKSPVKFSGACAERAQRSAGACR